jgi:bifunctional DNA primase/polymerase-like protein/AAA domain-containing protein/primase-like protein
MELSDKDLPRGDAAWLAEVAKQPTLSLLGLAAQDYAMRGWRVHPLAARDKKPLLKEWQKQASTDLAQVLTWWTQWPDANVGLVTGRYSTGLVVVDVDPRNGGMETLQTLRAQFPGGVLPWDMHNLVRTGSGGYHLYLDATRHFALGRELPAKLGPGIDLPLNVVAPPSVHPGGGIYTWVRGIIRQAEPLAEYPDVWLNALAAQPTRPRISGTDDMANARRALARLNPDRADRYDAQDGGWLAVGMALHAVSPDLLPDWDAWSKASPKYEAGVCAQKWAGFKDTAHGLTLGSLLAWASADRIRVRTFDKIALEKVEWLWPGAIPYGKLTLFIGDPGHGKSYLTVDLAARLSVGTKLPNGTKLARAERSLLVFCEDGAGDTVKPRLALAGANQQLVGELTVVGDAGEDRMLRLDEDLAALEAAIVRLGVRLLVLDPVGAYLGKKVNSWKDDDVRQLLGPVAQLADRTKSAIVGIMHLNKRQTANVLQRVTGAMAFTAVARSVVLVGPHPEDDEQPRDAQRKVFAPDKNNLGPSDAARVFRITDKGIVWEGTTETTAKDMVMTDMGVTRQADKRTAASNLLRAELAAGAKPSMHLYDLARAQGISPDTLRAAKADLGVVAKQIVAEGKNVWTWRLPEGDVPEF